MTPEEIIAKLREKADLHANGEHRADTTFVIIPDALHYENMRSAIYESAAMLGELMIELAKPTATL